MLTEAGRAAARQRRSIDCHLQGVLSFARRHEPQPGNVKDSNGAGVDTSFIAVKEAARKLP
jgi:hypothetical protein